VTGPLDVPLPVLAVAVGDPDSGLNDIGRHMAVLAILEALQNDEDAAAGWELLRHQGGIDAEGTIQDLTADQILLMCVQFYELVERGIFPDPREEIGEVVAVLPIIELDETEQELFNEIAATTFDRLKAQHYIHPTSDGSMEAEADLYVLLTGILTNCSDMLRQNDYEEDADVLDAASAIALKLFASHVREHRTPGC
jgi:hypothetical protein